LCHVGNVKIIKIFNLVYKIIIFLRVNGISSPNLYVEYRSARSFCRDDTRCYINIQRGGLPTMRRDTVRGGERGKREREGMRSVKFHRSDFSGWWNTFMKYLAKILCELIFAL